VLLTTYPVLAFDRRRGGCRCFQTYPAAAGESAPRGCRRFNKHIRLRRMKSAPRRVWVVEREQPLLGATGGGAAVGAAASVKRYLPIRWRDGELCASGTKNPAMSSGTGSGLLLSPGRMPPDRSPPKPATAVIRSSCRPGSCRSQTFQAARPGATEQIARGCAVANCSTALRSKAKKFHRAAPAATAQLRRANGSECV